MGQAMVQFLFRLLVIFVFLTCPVIAQGSSTREKVVIAQFGKEKFLLYLPLYIAMDEGLFAKQGLEVDLRFAGNDDQIFATVMSGSAQFGVGDPVFAAISREKGGPGKVIALMASKLGISGYTKRDAVPMIIGPQDAAGLRIGSLPAPSTTYTLLREFVQRNNLETTRLVQVAIGAQLAALEAGQVDIAVELEPAVSVAESKGYRVNFPFERFTEPQAITGLSTLESTIQQRPELVQKVVSALQDGLNLLHSDGDAALRTGEKLFPNLPKEVVARAVKRIVDCGIHPRTAVVEDVLWQRSLRTRLESGELKRPQSVDVTVDNRFALAASRG
jgi:NitT/TauT family transport system substrate-binding protein